MPRHNVLIEKKSEKEQLIVYEILGGKPNNTLLPSEQTIANRVTRPRQKGHTCALYALHMLRARCGKHTDIANTSERIVEAKISRARKVYTQIFVFENMFEFLSGADPHPDDVSNVALKGLIEYYKTAPNLPSQFTRQMLISTLQQFIDARKSDKNLKLEKFRSQINEEKSASAYEEILKIYDINPVSEYERLKHSIQMGSSAKNPNENNYQSLSTLKKNIFNSLLCDHFESENFHFTQVPWCYPDKNLENEQMMSEHFQKFMKIFIEQGPLICQGQYGKDFYADRKDNSISEFTIGTGQSSLNKPIELKAQYWRTEERIARQSGALTLNIYHVVVVVGLHAKNNVKLVYFMDPTDKSEPGDPPKIYAMSFKTFCEFGVAKDVLTAVVSEEEKGYILAAPPASTHEKLKPKYIGF